MITTVNWKTNRSSIGDVGGTNILRGLEVKNIRKYIC